MSVSESAGAALASPPSVHAHVTNADGTSPAPSTVPTAPYPFPNRPARACTLVVCPRAAAEAPASRVSSSPTRGALRNERANARCCSRRCVATNARTAAMGSLRPKRPSSCVPSGMRTRIVAGAPSAASSSSSTPAWRSFHARASSTPPRARVAPSRAPTPPESQPHRVGNTHPGVLLRRRRIARRDGALARRPPLGGSLGFGGGGGFGGPKDAATAGASVVNRRAAPRAASRFASEGKTAHLGSVPGVVHRARATTRNPPASRSERPAPSPHAAAAAIFSLARRTRRNLGLVGSEMTLLRRRRMSPADRSASAAAATRRTASRTGSVAGSRSSAATAASRAARSAAAAARRFSRSARIWRRISSAWVLGAGSGRAREPDAPDEPPDEPPRGPRFCAASSAARRAALRASSSALVPRVLPWPWNEAGVVWREARGRGGGGRGSAGGASEGDERARHRLRQSALHRRVERPRRAGVVL